MLWLLEGRLKFRGESKLHNVHCQCNEQVVAGLSI
jgi:hypothetical protein